MSVELEFSIGGAELTTHEGLSVEVRLRNTGDAALQIPSLYDTTAALTFELRGTGGGVSREMNGFTRQSLMTTARLDPTESLDELPPGGTWSRELHLSQFHFLLPAGNAELSARYEYEPAGIRIASRRAAVRVADPPPDEIRSWREFCMIDGFLLLLRATRAGSPEYYLRYQAYSRPLAAWYARRVLKGEAASDAICSVAAFSRAETFDPLFQRWMVWVLEGWLSAQLHAHGQPQGIIRRAPLPAGHRLLPWAFHRLDGTVFVFLETRPGGVGCYRFDRDALRPVFTMQLRGRMAAAGMDGETIHVLWESNGLVHDRFSLSGQPLGGQRLFRTRLPLYSCSFESGTQTVRACFRERLPEGMLQLFGAGLASDVRHEVSIDRLPLRRKITELTGEIDLTGKPHILAATEGAELYYIGPNLGPVPVARSRTRYFPRINVLFGNAYLGYYHPGSGYRFDEFNPRNVPRIVRFE